MAFTCFSKLPKELQLCVWELALLAESQDRVVLLHSSNHIIPQRHLASPFLRATRISRGEARRFYTVGLEVRGVPLLPQLVLLNDAERVFQYNLARMHTFTQKGKIYLNPNHDTFITGLRFTKHYVAKSGVEANSINGRDHATRPITKVLPPEACRQVRHLVLAQRGFEADISAVGYLPSRPDRPNEPDLVLGLPVHSIFAAKRLWNRRVFSDCTTFQHTWVSFEREERGYGDGFEAP